MDFNNFSNFENMENNLNEQMFNPMVQYEQAYVYYRYLCMYMDYKIKCKEYEKLCSIAENKKNIT